MVALRDRPTSAECTTPDHYAVPVSIRRIGGGGSHTRGRGCRFGRTALDPARQLANHLTPARDVGSRGTTRLVHGVVKADAAGRGAGRPRHSGSRRCRAPSHQLWRVRCEGEHIRIGANRRGQSTRAAVRRSPARTVISGLAGTPAWDGAPRLDSISFAASRTASCIRCDTVRGGRSCAVSGARWRLSAVVAGPRLRIQEPSAGTCHADPASRS